MSLVVDVMPFLRETIARLREGGWPNDAAELDAVARAGYTTSSEMLGEIGVAIVGVQRRLGKLLPVDIAEQLRLSLAEVGKVWPAFGDP